jgi:hypothetical protein
MLYIKGEIWYYLFLNLLTCELFTPSSEFISIAVVNQNEWYQGNWKLQEKQAKERSPSDIKFQVNNINFVNSTVHPTRG